MTDQSIMRISRCTEIKNDRDQAILWLDNLTFESGYIIMVSYYSVNPDNPERRFIDSILALGLKSGVGRDCYKVISVTKPRLIWGVCYMPNEIPDVSALVHGEEYLYHDPVTENWSLISCEDGSRKFTQISDYPQTLINLEDGTIWVSNENRRVRRLNDLADLYSREEIDRLLEYYEGTTNYNDLINKPSINGTSLVGNITIPIGDVNAISIHYNTLVNLRDHDELIPGTFYRITDYITVTSQEGTASAYNQFDIIVRADSENSLNENAFAAQPLEGQNSYFSNSNLSAWELKYCLDNDTRRFAWADSTTGTGVIYYMKDEWGNEAPYDFKNILFARYKVENLISRELSSDLLRNYSESIVLKGFYGLNKKSYSKGKVSFSIRSEEKYYYTFCYLTGEKPLDATVFNSEITRENIMYNNVIKPLYDDVNQYQRLNNGISVINLDQEEIRLIHDNYFSEGCSGWLLLDGCSNCTCGKECSDWICCRDCNFTCGDRCSNWICGENSFGWKCGNDCEDWAVGTNCCAWECGDLCSGWICYDESYNWKCDMECNNWVCENNCNDWYCGSNCNDWHIDKNCSNIVINPGNKYFAISGPSKNGLVLSGSSGTSNNIRIISFDGTDNHKICGTSRGKNFVSKYTFDNLIEISCNDLRNLRSRNELIPGAFYRIIDYNCTIKPYFDDNSFAVANHPFDIIVRADSKNSLNENASAIQHNGDTYFQSSNLQKWELKYNLYYDWGECQQYNWGDYTGTGLIYYMKDEFGNEAPYDFKNILFSRYRINDIISRDLSENLISDLKLYLVAGYYGLFPELYMKGNINFITDSKPVWQYTFDYNGSDASIIGIAYNNVIKPYIKNGVQCLNNGVINCSVDNNNNDDDKSFNNTIGYNCHDFTMLSGCYNCKCDNDCNSWISASCSGWTCGSGSSNWICGKNSFGWNCGSGCENWVCGSESSLWSCGNNSSNWYVDPECYNWTCGMCCSNWHCYIHSYSWSCGNDCCNWSMSKCSALSCGNHCNNWDIERGDNIIIDSGTCNINIDCNSCSYIKVYSGNYNDERIMIADKHVIVGINSRGSIVIYNPSDLIYSGGS